MATYSKGRARHIPNNIDQNMSTKLNLTTKSPPINVEELRMKTPNEIVSRLNSNPDWLNESKVGNDATSLYLGVISKACSSDQTDSLNLFLEHLLKENEKFLNNDVLTYLLETRRTNRDETSLKNIVRLIEKLQDSHPLSSIKTTQILLPLVRATISPLDNDTLLKLDQLDSVKDQLLDDYNFVYHGVNAEKEVPNDFRQIPIFPDKNDLILNTRPFLRPNVVEGRYANPNHYLDVQFRLLREDFVRPLRQGIATYLDRIKSRPNNNVRSDEMRLYRDVTLRGMQVTDEGVIHVVKFDAYPFRNVQWETSKRLIYGSLVCLTHDDFKSFFFGTVADRNVHKLKDGEISIKFEEHDVIMASKDRNFIMVESEAYFESTRHVLLSLQNIDQSNFPFKEYIVELRKKIDKPGYLTENSVFCFGNLVNKVTRKITEPKTIPDNEWLENIKPKNSDFEIPRSKKGSKRAKPKFNCLKLQLANPNPDPNCDCVVKNDVEIFNEESWPLAEDFNLDQSQYEALKSAIRQKLCIIQGPPGTGKTYIGLKILEALLHNKKWWNESYDDDKRNPILVVCYTNHALDQFMEGVLKITNKILRVGGRSSSETLQPYSMNVLKKEYVRNMKPEIEFVLNQIKTFEIKLNRLDTEILTEFELKEAMGETQHRCFQAGSPQSLRTRDRMKIWLGIETDSATNQVWKPNPRTNEKECQMDLEILENGLDDEESMDRYVPIKQTDRRRVINIEKTENKIENIKWPTITSKLGPNLSDKQLLGCTYLWRNLDLMNRGKLYKLWLEKQRNIIKVEISNLKRVYDRKIDIIRSNSVEIETLVAKSVLVVGMTTTGASKYRTLVANLKSQIVVVEEAAEVLEAHVVTSLSPDTRHLILIGDHQQLRPTPVVYDLAKKYHLDVSLFERLINNGVPFVKLRVQHRMRPEISRLLVPSIYRDLEDHVSVRGYEDVVGFKRNVFFLNHREPESEELDGTSRVNVYEARFLVQLCKYVLQQGYHPDRITILTTYLGQLSAIKELLTGSLKAVKANVVDNYQGEENDIVLVSFVRSNYDGDIGFLQTENRICVALSRAKIGLYCVGNFDLLADKSRLWSKITRDLWEKEAIGDRLTLKCLNHGEENHVGKASDFARVPEGGCRQPCDYRLRCGHSCNKKCHPVKDHDNVYCIKPCRRVTRGRGCTKLCGQVCDVVSDGRKVLQCGHRGDDECEVLINVIGPCKHKIAIRCKSSKDEAILKSSCGEPCPLKLPCGHDCGSACSQPCQMKCNYKVEVRLPCGHNAERPCHESNDAITRCLSVLDCGHECSGRVIGTCVGNCSETSTIKSSKSQLPSGVLSVTIFDQGPRQVGIKSTVQGKSSGHCPQNASSDKRSLDGKISVSILDEGHRVVIEDTPTILSCGHRNLKPGQTECGVKVEVTLPCGHRKQIACFKSGKKITECETILDCGHNCICERRLRATCVQKCRNSRPAQPNAVSKRSIMQINNWLTTSNRR